MKIYRTILAAATLTASLLNVSARTPYSMYGYGILNDNATSTQRAMGGVGYAMQSGRQINVMNPASYAAMDSMTFLFDMGINTQNLWSNDNGTRGSEFTGGLDYITMQVPLAKGIGASFGVVPFSSVGYSFGTVEEGLGTSSRIGSGGINQLYLGTGMKLFKGLSIGINAGYLFGNTINDVYATPTDNVSVMFERLMTVRDLRYEAGLQYTHKLGQRSSLTIGATVAPSKSLNGTASLLGIYNPTTSSPTTDTIATKELKGNFTLPDMWGVGINYKWDNRLTIEADMSHQAWSKALYTKLDDNDGEMLFNDRIRYGLGMEYIPRTRGSYFQVVSYRFGAHYAQDYIKIGKNNVDEYGLSFGLGLPSMGTKTMINLGVEWRHRQGRPNPLIKENYLLVNLGINFNEVWFFQRKLR